MDFKKLELENIDIDEESVGFFRFKKLKNNYLITNDFGYFSLLKPEEFKKFLEGGLDQNSDLYENLYKKGFLKRDLSKLKPLVDRYSCRNSIFCKGPSLHIIVTTLRCNHNCVYCQASAKGMDEKNLDLDKDTAKKIVDKIFETTSNSLIIEFQGGEPMANWDVVKFIVNYSRKKEKETKKDVSFSLVSNLSLMNEKRFNFLIDKTVGLCTSLDGPKELHNKNRPYKGDSYKQTIKWIKKYKKKEKELTEKGDGIPLMHALVTISKFSLDYPEEIINEYVKLGYFGLHLRPLSKLGYSKGKNSTNIGYSVDDFFNFWKKSIDYIVELNEYGDFYERGAKIMLKKILTANDPAYTELSSPCGAVRGQLLYNHNGDVYTCDEGRMIEDDSFKLGNVENSTYEEMVKSDVAQTVFASSTLENQPCDFCAYKPYCGICPVKNYAHYGTLFPNIRETDWCKLKTKQFNYLFEKLKNEKYKKVFEKWVKTKPQRSKKCEL